MGLRSSRLNRVPALSAVFCNERTQESFPCHSAWSNKRHNHRPFNQFWMHSPVQVPIASAINAERRVGDAGIRRFSEICSRSQNCVKRNIPAPYDCRVPWEVARSKLLKIFCWRRGEILLSRNDWAHWECGVVHKITRRSADTRGRRGLGFHSFPGRGRHGVRDGNDDAAVSRILESVLSGNGAMFEIEFGDGTIQTYGEEKVYSKGWDWGGEGILYSGEGLRGGGVFATNTPKPTSTTSHEAVERFRLLIRKEKWLQFDWHVEKSRKKVTSWWARFSTRDWVSRVLSGFNIGNNTLGQDIICASHTEVNGNAPAAMFWVRTNSTIVVRMDEDVGIGKSKLSKEIEG